MGVFAATMLCRFIWCFGKRPHRGHAAGADSGGGCIWHLLIMPLTMLAAVASGDSRRRKLFEGARKRNENQPPWKTGPSRREVTARGRRVPPLVAAGLVGVALPQLNDFRWPSRDVPVANLPDALEGLTIAHVSDVHVGKYTNGRVLEEIVEKVNAMSADLVMFSGDLIDFSMKDLPRGIEMIKGLRGKYGLFMCEGNHDLFEDPDGFERQVKDAGLPLLLNESRIVSIKGQAVQIAGIRWSSGAVMMVDPYAAMPRRRAMRFQF
jgi:hypothetical protein